MKINYDFYSGQDLYSDGDIENEIIEYAKSGKSADEIFKDDMRWPVFYHLSPIRQNVLNWYPFEGGAEVLEIGAGMGAITECLCDNCKSVVSVELSKNRASCIAARNADKDNLEIIVANFNDIDFKDRKFDYITLIGVFEYAKLYTGTDTPFNSFLDKIKGLLKENGKLLIAIENQFGIKYFAGAPEDHLGQRFLSFTGYDESFHVKTFGKKELKKVLAKSGFKFTQFYYPLPDYKLPLKIFSDKCLPTEKSIEEYTPYYLEGSSVIFDEIAAYKEIIKNGEFDFFANSFIVECSREKIETKVDCKSLELTGISEVSKDFFVNKYNESNKDEEIKSLNEKVSEFENSTSWKITKPIRKVKDMFSK